MEVNQISNDQLEEVINVLEKYDIISLSEEDDTVGFTESFKATLDIIIAEEGDELTLAMAGASEAILENLCGPIYKELSLGYRSAFCTLLAHLAKQGYWSSNDTTLMDDELILDMAIYIECLQDAYIEDVENEAASEED